MISSLIIDKEIVYPASDEFFSPDEHYPEYPFVHRAVRPNRVYRGVRECLVQAGMDAENFGLPHWNPLRSVVPAGSRVFVLCNFVYHRRNNESLTDFAGKCTHGSVLRALLDYLLLAVGPTGTIRFGNAPVQSCDWSKVLNDTGAQTALDFYNDYAPGRVEACDLRSHKVKRNALGVFTQVDEAGVEAFDVNIDIGIDSMLEELYANTDQPQFRSLDYNPESTERFHAPGKHLYAVNRRILETDVIFSLPKLKVHEKVGATLAVKGCVGGIAHKHCLAHFRLGSSQHGGDEFAGFKLFNTLESWLGECTNRLRESTFKNFCRTANYLIRKWIVRVLGRNVGGGWAGNDTTWRMSMDIARILSYADEKGNLVAAPQRKHMVLVDGIVGGEGQGPLSPTARQVGLLLYSDDIVAGDYLACRYMGLDPTALPINSRAFTLKTYPLTSLDPSSLITVHNGKTVSDVESVSPPFRMPYGW